MNDELRWLLTGGDRRSIADSNRVRAIVETHPARVRELASIVRALPLFLWTPAQMKRVEAILLENVAFPQTFVRAWALNSLATLAMRRKRLAPIVERHLLEFETSSSKALRARARYIRARTS